MSIAVSLEDELGGKGRIPPSMLERMTLILDVFETPATRLTLVEVARYTNLPRSTVHRILEQLVALRWLEHTRPGYGLGSRARRLGGGGSTQVSLRNAAAPRIHELHVRTGLVAHLAVLDGAEVEYLDKLGGRFATRVPSRVGGRLPACATALGKAVLAWLDPEEVDHRVVAAGPDRAALHQQLGRIRARGGLAFELGEGFARIACAAVAVRGPDGPVAAISLAGGADAPLERVAPLVVAAARQTSVELFPELRERVGPTRTGGRLVSVGPRPRC